MDLAIIDNDIQIVSGSPLIDNSLDVAIRMSLFTDARLDNDAEIPDRSDDRRGWWGDALGDDPIGSLLWTLDRSKINNELLNQIDKYSADALKWLVDEGIASDVSIVVERDQINTSRINWEITVVKPNSVETFNYSAIWENI